mmetsp:Transcript_23887/g.33183  ORF Transcript_23887/g.33183 Transcript_23887/m.33183 type:complete len:308 (+) Transcript_23887:26-949(+)
MDADDLRDAILRLPGTNNKLPQAREIGVLIIDMLDDEEILETLSEAVGTGKIENLENALIQIMEQEGLDKESFNLPEDQDSLQIPLDEARIDRLNYIHKLLFNAGGGTRIAEMVFMFYTESPLELSRLQLVCKLWNKRLQSNSFWRPLATKKWTYLAAIDPAIIKNWRLFYAARTVALLESRNKGSKVRPWLGKNDSSKEVVPIENCAYGLVPFEEKNLPSGFKWKFKCPVSLANLKKTKNMKVDYCNICKKNVYLVQNEGELKEHVSKGNCVALDLEQKIASVRGPRPRPHPIRRGRVAIRRPMLR